MRILISKSSLKISSPLTNFILYTISVMTFKYPPPSFRTLACLVHHLSNAVFQFTANTHVVHFTFALTFFCILFVDFRYDVRFTLLFCTEHFLNCTLSWSFFSLYPKSYFVPWILCTHCRISFILHSSPIPSYQMYILYFRRYVVHSFHLFCAANSAVYFILKFVLWYAMATPLFNSAICRHNHIKCTVCSYPQNAFYYGLCNLFLWPSTPTAEYSRDGVGFKPKWNVRLLV